MGTLSHLFWGATLSLSLGYVAKWCSVSGFPNYPTGRGNYNKSQVTELGAPRSLVTPPSPVLKDETGNHNSPIKMRILKGLHYIESHSTLSFAYNTPCRNSKYLNCVRTYSMLHLWKIGYPLQQWTFNMYTVFWYLPNAQCIPILIKFTLDSPWYMHLDSRFSNIVAVYIVLFALACNFPPWSGRFWHLLPNQNEEVCMMHAMLMQLLLCHGHNDKFLGNCKMGYTNSPCS